MTLINRSSVLPVLGAALLPVLLPAVGLADAAPTAAAAIATTASR